MTTTIEFAIKMSAKPLGAENRGGDQRTLLVAGQSVPERRTSQGPGRGWRWRR